MTIVGWIAMAAILATYGLVARRPQHMRAYNLVNCVTAPLFVVLAVRGHAYPNAALSGAFGLIALWALLWPRRKLSPEIVALAEMYAQYCPGPYGHDFMSAGEEAEEVLRSHGLLKEDWNIDWDRLG